MDRRPTVENRVTVMVVTWSQLRRAQRTQTVVLAEPVNRRGDRDSSLAEALLTLYDVRGVIILWVIRRQFHLKSELLTWDESREPSVINDACPGSFNVLRRVTEAMVRLLATLFWMLETMGCLLSYHHERQK